MTHQEKGHGVQAVANQNISAASLLEPSPQAKAKQRSTILEALKSGGISTVDCRERLGILHPAGRVLELRRQGWLIDTVPVTRFDDQGRPHRIAFYKLRGGAA